LLFFKEKDRNKLPSRTPPTTNVGKDWGWAVTFIHCRWECWEYKQVQNQKTGGPNRVWGKKGWHGGAERGRWQGKG
jgi:hypothetical protein